MSSRFSLMGALAVFAVGIGLLLSSIAVWLRFQIHIPVHDTVYLLPFVKSGVIDGWQSLSLSDWLSPISGNIHRIVVTRLLMLVDYTFLSGSNYAIYLSTWVSIALLLFTYLRAADLQLSENRASRYFIAGISLIFLCSPSQYLNLVNPINASWYVAMASSAVSVLIIISAGNRLTFGLLILACIFAAIAAFSNFSGVLTCLILPVVALHQRSRLAGLVLIFSAALIFLYFHGVESNHSGVVDPRVPQKTVGAATTAMSELVTQLKSSDLRLNILITVTRNVGLHLGAPLSVKHPFMASLAVLVSTLLIGYQWLVLGLKWCFQKEPVSRSVEFTLVMATICLGISCVIPLGRTNFYHPQAERYQTITMVYWLSISCLIFFKAQNLDGKRQFKRALVLLACIPALPIFGALGFAMPPVIALSNNGNATQILGRMGVNRFENLKSVWARGYGTYFKDHEEFLTAYSFKPLSSQLDSLQGVKVEQALCDGISVKESATMWPGVQEIYLRLDGSSVNPFLTRLDLRGSNGELGRLHAHAHVPQKFELHSTFLDARKWFGFYRGDINQSMPITLFFDPIIGRRYQCVLPEKGN